MKMYKVILDILDKKGSASIPLIWQEMNDQNPHSLQKHNLKIEQSYIKSFIKRKNEIFQIKDDLVSIRPEKEPVFLTAVFHGYPGPEIRVKIDFTHNRFTYFEWNLDSRSPVPFSVNEPGSIDEFKKQLYFMNVWNWNEDYQRDGIIVDGTSWTVNLVTKGKTYESGGLESFPKEWRSFCRSISRLTGKKILC